jgi:formate dehydrogenase subunit gamma
MAATTTPPDAGAGPAAGALPPDSPIIRFDRVERIAHWVNAILFGLVMFTGSILYIGELSVLFGNREIVRFIHVYCGLAIPVVFLVAYSGRWGRALRRDFSQINRWSKDDKRWFRTMGRDKKVQLGKFNSGQKLNAAFVVGATLVMAATGSIMHWFNPFPVDVRTGATFVHDWFAFFIWTSVLGHIWFAFADKEALNGMWRGTVTARWARTKRPRWYDETTKDQDDPAT